MAALDLTKYGITGTTEIVHNPSYEQLFEEETKETLEGYEKGQVTELGAVNVKTGIGILLDSPGRAGFHARRIGAVVARARRASTTPSRFPRTNGAKDSETPWSGTGMMATTK